MLDLEPFVLVEEELNQFLFPSEKLRGVGGSAPKS